MCNIVFVSEQNHMVRLLFTYPTDGGSMGNCCCGAAGPSPSKPGPVFSNLVWSVS